MLYIRVAAGALNQTPLDWDGNRRNIEQAIREAKSRGATVLCLPELCISGYGCEDAFQSVGVAETAMRVLREILPAAEGIVVSLGLPIFHRGAVYNAAALIVDGRIAGFVCKQNLAGDGIHYEPRWFRPWPSGVQSTIDLDGESFPIGDLVFQCGDVLLGFEICEDAWVADRPGTSLARRGVDLILNPSASHFAFGKQDIRRRFVLEGARAYHVGYVYANLLGNEAGRAIYDGGTMIAAEGAMLAEGPRFSYADCHVTTASIDVHATRMARARGTRGAHPLEPSRAVDALPIHVDFAFPELEPEAPSVRRDTWDDGVDAKEEEFARAVPLALYDYMRKSRSRGFVVSLSGGADSSTVASAVWLSVCFGLESIGREAFLAKLAHIPGIEDAHTPKTIVRRLLTCVYQSTRNSSDTTRNAASDVAEAIGAEFLELDVDGLVEGYVDMIATAIDRRPNWDEDDLALQNIQARSRAPGVWFLANLRNALLLATSNRSEAAVGYATMDGDTCGGLSPIAGIDKFFLRHWLRWMETQGPRVDGRRMNLPSLRAVNEQQPTAELRPAESHQTDEDDLMPYEILDAIERAAIRDKQPPIDVLRVLRPRFPQYDQRQLGRWVERFFQLWTRNQWKRERYAPSFHLDDENLDPKTWCRFPILSGGFARELRELREHVGGLATDDPK